MNRSSSLCSETETLEMVTTTESNQWKAFCQALKYPIQGTANTLSVIKLPREAVNRLLAPTTRTTGGPTIHGADLLNAVRSLDEWTADSLGCRDDSLDEFRFKVVQGSRSSEYSGDVPVTVSCQPEKALNAEDISSYIAVSYCWHYNTWKPALGLQCDAPRSTSDQEVPLMPAMLAALLEERSSDVEPLWLDQWCINQKDKDNDEKIVAIGMMDLLYSNARKVVVCLEDVRLSANDMGILLDFGRYLEENPGSYPMNTRDIKEWDWDGKEGHLFEAVTKIFAARWFSRAWCAHEYWLGQDHVFLVPVTIDPTNAVPEDGIATILRFNSGFLFAAHYFTSMWIPGDRPGSMDKKVRHWQENVKHTHPYYWDGIFDFADGQICSKLAFTHAMRFFGGFGSAPKTPSHQVTFAVVNTLGSTNMADKLAITLNVGRTGLYLTGKQDLSVAEITWMATIVALASGDATVLASTGPPILSVGSGRVGNKSEDEIGWACVPDVDRYIQLDERLFGAKIPLAISKNGLELDVIHLGTSFQIHAPDRLKTCLAEATIDWLCDREQQSSIFVSTSLHRRHLIQALGCLLTGGVSWTIACATQVRLHPVEPLRYLSIAQSQTVVEAAFRALDRIVFRLEALDPSSPTASIDLEATKEELDEKQRRGDIMQSVKSLVTVADGLVRTVIGEQGEYDDEKVSAANELQVCVSNTEMHGGIVIFAPPASQSDYELVCPDVLRKKDKFNTNMRKGWILQGTSVPGHMVQDVRETTQTRYRLLCKTTLFMPLAFDTDDPVKDSDPFGIYHPRKVIVG